MEKYSIVLDHIIGSRFIKDVKVRFYNIKKTYGSHDWYDCRLSMTIKDIFVTMTLNYDITSTSGEDINIDMGTYSALVSDERPSTNLENVQIQIGKENMINCKNIMVDSELDCNVVDLTVNAMNAKNKEDIKTVYDALNLAIRKFMTTDEEDMICVYEVLKKLNETLSYICEDEDD